MPVNAAALPHTYDIRLVAPAPRFWRITFPPEDWNPADRKLPTAPAMPQSSTSK